MIGKTDSRTDQSPDPHSGEGQWRATDETGAESHAKDDTPHQRVAVAAAGGAFMTF